MGLYVTILSSIHYKFHKHDWNGTNSQDFILVLHLEMDFKEYNEVQSNSHVFS